MKGYFARVREQSSWAQHASAIVWVHTPLEDDIASTELVILGRQGAYGHNGHVINKPRFTEHAVKNDLGWYFNDYDLEPLTLGDWLRLDEPTRARLSERAEESL